VNESGPLPRIDYPALLDQALLELVRRVLQRAAAEGLPGDHHFYLTFRTKAPGVKLSPYLLAQHPEEMTIVLQHQFWDLEVDEAVVSVTLRFGGGMERLTIPFSALASFADPSVQFALPLNAAGTSQPAAAAEPATPVAEPAPAEPRAPARIMEFRRPAKSDEAE
jgi:uncharacterized protein